MSSENLAAWAVAHKVTPYEIKPAPLGVPGENQILIRNHAVGINGIDHLLQHTDVHKDDFTYPAIFGQDVTGEVVSVGPNVTQFKVGDRVAAFPRGFLSKNYEEMAFQKFTVLSTDTTVRIPDSMTYERAVTFPLGISTAAVGLFDPNYLNLQVPTEPAQKPTGKIVLVWGGASCVGSSAIQLAVAAGYEVLTTASPKNHAAVKKLGASHVFDYHSPTVVGDLLEAAKGKECAGIYDAIGIRGGWEPTQEFASKVDGNKFIASTVPGWPETPEGVTAKFIFAPLISTTHVARAVWVDYLPKALEVGTFTLFTEPFVFGEGLESVQGAVDYLGTTSISAQKVVVTLE